ncbi:ribonuclease H-like domain-containing protein [Mycena crocata]|nr:ribonuclease H-like domain-containing protein [Mycena crocata]
MEQGSWGRDYFVKGDKKFKNDTNHWESRCKGCIARRVIELKEVDGREVNSGVREYMRSPEELESQAISDVPPVCGKTERWVSHLSRCLNVSQELRAVASASRRKENATGMRLSRVQQVARAAVLQVPEPETLWTRPNRTLPSAGIVDAMMALNVSHSASTPQLPVTTRNAMWDPVKQEEFAQDLCKVFVACNITWNSASNPQLNLFFSKYIPEAKIPDRRVLSGRVLDSLVVQAETRMKSSVSGKFGTGQCDGWKSNAKASIITTSVTVEGQVYMIAAHDVSPEKKSADNLLELVLQDIQYCEDELGIIMIGYCTDNGGDAKGMRVNLVVAEILELEIPCMEAVDDGLEIVKWFTNHSRALGLLKDHQKTTDRYKETKRILTLMYPVIHRWVYHFLAVRRLLTLSKPMRTLCLVDHAKLIECAGTKAEAKAKAKKVLEPIDDPQFWKKLAEVKVLLEPLAVAAKVMQAPDAGLDQVLLMLGNLYRLYGSSDIDSRVRSCLRKSLEKRWLAMEREVFIIAVYLNPYIRGAAFSKKNPALKPISLYNIAKQLYTRFFDEEPDLDFHAAFFDYSRDSREFSRSYMQLAEMKQLYERENKRVSVVAVWEQLDTGEANGRNGLVKLAIWVLSIVGNSAGSERGFSKFGLFLTKLRSLLSIQKVRKMNTVDMDLKRTHEELGLTTDRLKRKFAHFTEQITGPDTATAGNDAPDSFTGLMTQLIDDLAETRNAPIDEEEEETDDDPIPTVHSRSNYTLKELFEYPKDDDTDNLANGLGFHWLGGVKDLQEELELYDLLMEDLDA